MKRKYIYEIVWEYMEDDSESHRTLVEVARPSGTLAALRFTRFYNSTHRFTRLPYEVISVRFLGELFKKCW